MPLSKILVTYFSTTTYISIVINPLFGRVPEIFIFIVVTSSFWNVFHHIDILFTFFDYGFNKYWNRIFTKVWFNRLTKFIINAHYFITIIASNMFFIFVRMKLICILLSIFFWHYKTFKICMYHKWLCYFSLIIFESNTFTFFRHLNFLFIIPGKYRESAHTDCNMKVKLNQKIPAVSHNLKKLWFTSLYARTK